MTSLQINFATTVHFKICTSQSSDMNLGFDGDAVRKAWNLLKFKKIVDSSFLLLPFSTSSCNVGANKFQFEHIALESWSKFFEQTPSLDWEWLFSFGGKHSELTPCWLSDDETRPQGFFLSLDNRALCVLWSDSEISVSPSRGKWLLGAFGNCNSYHVMRERSLACFGPWLR